MFDTTRLSVFCEVARQGSISAAAEGLRYTQPAVSRQVATLAHTSNLYLHEPGLRLAERLTGLLGRPAGVDARVFFCSTGT